jgi:hypothetical protein
MSQSASLERLRALAAAELSTTVRIRYAALLLVSLAAAGLVSSLWLTEPDLPARTHLAFAAITGAALFWAAAAARTLMTRRVLLGQHRVVVARLAVGFSAVMVVGAVAAVFTGAMGPAAYPAAVFAVLMLAASAAALAAARRQVARLEARRHALEHELGHRPRAGRAE